MKKILAAVLLLGVSTALLAAPLVRSPLHEARALGWEAGVVAPSPIKERYANVKFKTRQEAEAAGRDAEAELARCAKIREYQRALCNEKVLVNRCMDQAEKVLRERERFASLLMRKSNHHVRIFKSEEKRARNNKPNNLMPAQRGDISTKVQESDKKLSVKAQRRLQEGVNLEARQEKIKENEARKARVLEEAKKRQADREARRARYEADRQKRQAAQKSQSEQKSK